MVVTKLKKKFTELTLFWYLCLHFLSGCTTFNNSIRKNYTKDYVNYISNLVTSSINDLEENRNFNFDILTEIIKLKDNEYAVPDDIFDIYANIVDSIQTLSLAKPMAGYVDINRLKDDKAIQKFFSQLYALGYSYDEALTFYRILKTPGTIFIRESALTDKDFESMMLHERIHKYFHKLPAGIQDMLWNTAFEITHMDITSEEDCKKYGIDPDELSYTGHVRLLEENPNLPSNRVVGIYEFIVSINPFEFYPYLAMGIFHPRVENALKKFYPEAYKYYINILKKAKSYQDYMPEHKFNTLTEKIAKKIISCLFKR